MSSPVFMRGETVTLRPHAEDDVEFLWELVNHPDVWPSLATYGPTTEAEEEEWVENAADEGGTHFVVYADDDPVGTLGLDHINETWGLAEVGYMIHPDAQGNGYATDATRRLVRYAFEDRRLHKVQASVYGPNVASQRVLEKVGFEQEGVFESHAYVRGEYVDLHRYGLLESAFES